MFSYFAIKRGEESTVLTGPADRQLCVVHVVRTCVLVLQDASLSAPLHIAKVASGHTAVHFHGISSAIILACLDLPFFPLSTPAPLKLEPADVKYNTETHLSL